jgi:hypothetical protein
MVIRTHVQSCAIITLLMHEKWNVAESTHFSEKEGWTKDAALYDYAIQALSHSDAKLLHSKVDEVAKVCGNTYFAVYISFMIDCRSFLGLLHDNNFLISAHETRPSTN